VLAAMRFGHTRIRLAHTRVDSARGSTAAGRAIAEKLQADDLTAVFTLIDGLLLNGPAYIEALGAALPTDVVVTGGLAGDGERASGLPATGLFPLAIRNQEDMDGVTVRTILGVDEEKQSITFAGDVPEGRMVKLMRANFDRLVDGAASAAERIQLTDYPGGPALCVAISCVGRRLVLGPRVEEEIEAVKESLPAEVCQIGYYSYGEISPLASGRCDLHNQTMTLTMIWEAA
jgi:hypothetical protein